jgi:hypothetical protein
MLNFVRLFLISLIFVNCVNAQSIKKNSSVSKFTHTSILDANQVKISLTNTGTLDPYYKPSFGISGATWEQLRYRDPLSGQLVEYYYYIVYDQGFWIIGRIQDTLSAGIAQWESSYSQGPIINGLPAMISNPGNSSKYRTYKISRGDDDSNIDYKEWPVEYGAPVDEYGKPLVKGDQTIYTVYNAYDSSVINNNYWGIKSKDPKPLPVEVQQIAFSHNRGKVKDNIDVFANTVFFEWTLINKSQEFIDSAYIGLWTDIDFLYPDNNPMGVDTINQIGYCYMKNDSLYAYLHTQYIGGAAPAVGYVLLYGPAIPESNSDFAIIQGKKKAGFKNIPLNSFHGIIDDSTPPPYGIARDINQMFYYAKGLEADGEEVIDRATGNKTTFQFSGDPITNTGWVYHRNGTGGGAGFVMFAGPFTMAPMDTQWVMAALIPAQGNNAMESIKLLREKSELLRSLPYDTLAFGVTPYKLNYVDTTNIDLLYPSEFQLFQNYPNPFNNITKIVYLVSTNTFVTLKIFDILGREVATLVNGEKNQGEYVINFNGSQLSSGVYIYRLQAGSYTDSKKMILLK